ncbi:MAG: SpoIIE family protein phosphatase [Chlorobi bacterium]|nr:SpoIIE family protein phosphatase [Chlorobiota bacterium]
MLISPFKKIKTFAFLFFALSNCVAQLTEIDSVKILLLKKMHDTVRIDNYLELAHLYSTVNTDSAIFYGNRAMKLSENINYDEGILRGYILNGISYYKQSKYEISDSLLSIGYELAKLADNKLGIANACINKGLVYTNQNKYLDAIQNFKIALKNYEIIGSTENINAVKVNIGIIYYYQGNVKEALHYHLNALKKMDTLNVYKRRHIVNVIQNIGAFYSELGKPDSAMMFTKRALRMHTENGNKKGMAICYNNLGDFEKLKGNIFKALSYYKKSLALKKEIKDLRGLIITNNSIGQLLIQLGSPGKAKTFLYDALKYANIVNDKQLIKDTYGILAVLNDSIQNYKEAYLNYKLFHIYYDSVQQNATNKQLLDLQTKYETEKKEQKIKILEAEKRFQNLKIQKSRLITTLLIAGVFLLALFIAYLYVSLRNRRKRNHLLRLKNETLNQQKKEIAAQKDEIEKHRTAILDSINYAKQIQHALLPLEEQFKKYFKQYFIYYRPKDIISGDFYWIRAVGQYVYFTVSDCTGHGVPGALMSMLGISFLNEIVNEKYFLKPAEVLEELRIMVKNSLKQTGSRNQNRDGMDIALCRLDTENNELIYAGANNSIILIRDKKLEEISPVNNPIGVYIKETPFIDNKIALQKDDVIYLYSDGYIDQMNGENGNRFLFANFKKLLIEICQKDLQEQKYLLNERFELWKKKSIQIDDVTVLGIKI